MVSISWPRDPPALASQSAGITGVSHRTRPLHFYLKNFCIVFINISKLISNLNKSTFLNYLLSKDLGFQESYYLVILDLTTWKKKSRWLTPPWWLRRVDHKIRRSRPLGLTWRNPVSTKKKKYKKLTGRGGAHLQFQLLGRLRQEYPLNPGGGDCSEPRSRHCSTAWATVQDSVSKKNFC